MRSARGALRALPAPLRPVAAHPRGKEGRVVYDLQGDFGCDPAALRKRFGFYFEAFPEVRPEV